MTDIAKCDGENCDCCWRCMRFIAPVDPVGQTWIAPDTDERGEKCSEFWEVPTDDD